MSEHPDMTIWEVDQAIMNALPEAFQSVIKERDALRAENARLKSEVDLANGFREELRSKFHIKCDVLSEAIAHIEALRSDLQRHKQALEKCKAAFDRVWEVEEMGYTPDDPESESGVCTCDKCEGVQHHNHRSHSENCPQPIIEDALRHIDEVLK